MFKKVMYINLSKQTYEVKSVSELNSYIGGVGIGLKLLADNLKDDPLILSIGPLNGFFPFASKTSIVFFSHGTVEDIYLGGSLSTRMRFTGLDSIVIQGKSKNPVILDITNENIAFRSIDNDPESLGLPGKKSVIKPVLDKFVLDNFFVAPEQFLEKKFSDKNIRGLTLTGTKTYEITDEEKYSDLYHKILSQEDSMIVEKEMHPSCSGCPMGCNKSKVGEISGNVLVHSLVGCAYAEKIYSNIGIVFSCLNILGYDYTHEDIEYLPVLIENVLKELS